MFRQVFAYTTIHYYLTVITILCYNMYVVWDLSFVIYKHNCHQLACLF